jgi:hypothetical protein
MSTPCQQFPVVTIVGDKLVTASHSGPQRFFAAGMVLSGGGAPQLSGYDAARVRLVLEEHRRLGATVLRWNAFLKGVDFEWGRDGHIVGLVPGCFEAVRRGLDDALSHGVLVQVVLATAHFLRFGWGGPENTLGGIKNRDRVVNIQRMMSSSAGIDAYIERVLDPLLEAIGPHPALMGFLIVNEGYAMVRKAEKALSSETDATIGLSDLQRWVNRVAGAIHRSLPGALLSSSLKLMVSDRWHERKGLLPLALWFEDEALVKAGGDVDGTLDLHQYQYYPETTMGEEDSPFLNTVQELRELHKSPMAKPMLCGEFPIEGLSQVR